MVTSVCLQTPLTELYNDLGDVVRLFFGEVSVSAEKGDLCIVHSMDELGHLVRIGECSARRPLTPACSDPLLEKRLRKRAAKSCLYDALKAYTGQKPPWGSLTGIRPTRLFFEQLEQGKSMEEAERALCKTFDLDADKASLLRQIAQVQRALSMPKPGDIDVYVGIPFCTTRCTYCSFAATDLKHGGPLVDPYVEAVQREMRLCAPSLAGYRVRCIYIGGGTPTALRVDQLAQVIETAKECFPCQGEFTVEAGRPDTITPEMLKMLREHGVGRVSVNPQTMNDETLRRIGRAHSAGDVVRAFGQIREAGFDAVNMDVILGLPGETLRDVEDTLSRIQQLDPDNLTVHTLAIKRASKLHELGQQPETPQAQQMVDFARQRAGEMGMEPYYLYRQKYMAGNLENVGYAKPGKACLYNVDIMEEIAPIAAFGAGAISKWLYPRTRRIERAPNVKNIEQYIQRVEEMARRKQALWEARV